MCLAQQYSDCGSAKSCGDLGYFAEGTLLMQVRRSSDL